jgi:hypothetical protein
VGFVGWARGTKIHISYGKEFQEATESSSTTSFRIEASILEIEIHYKVG